MTTKRNRRRNKRDRRRVNKRLRKRRVLIGGKCYTWKSIEIRVDGEPYYPVVLAGP